MWRRRARAKAHRTSPRHCCNCSLRPATRTGIVGDVVDRAAKGVDFVHRVALRLRQDAHGRIERAAGRFAAGIACRGFGGGHGARQLMRRAAGRSRRRAAGAKRRKVPAITARCRPRPGRRRLPRCTRSLSGSRCRRIRTRRSASDWITETSSPDGNPRSWPRTARWSAAIAPVRLARPCRQFASSGEARVCAERRHVAAGGGKGVERDIDAVEIAVVLACNPGCG